MKIQPLYDRVLIQVDKLPEKVGELYMPQTLKDKPQEATVIRLGTGLRNADGSRVPFDVKPKDRIIIAKYGGAEVTLDGKDYQIVREDDILAVKVE